MPAVQAFSVVRVPQRSCSGLVPARPAAYDRGHGTSARCEPKDRAEGWTSGHPVPRGVSEDSAPEQVFSGSPRGLELFHAVERLLAAPTPPAVRATKSEVAFRERRAFAFFGGRGATLIPWCPPCCRSRSRGASIPPGSRRSSTPRPGCGCIIWSCTTRSSSTPRLPAGCTRPVRRRAKAGAGRVVAERGGQTGMVRPPGRVACYVWSIRTFLAVLSGAATGAGARTSSTPSL